jgi:hypothetical protein
MLKTYGAYLFKQKDPAIDELRTVVEDHFGHRVNNKDLTQISEDGGPTVGTMKAWFFGKTRRPQNPTLEAAGRAMGFRRRWVKMDGTGKKT